MDMHNNPFLYIPGFSVRTPRLLITGLVVVHTLSFIFPWFTGLNGNFKLIASALVLLSFFYSLYLLGKNRVKQLTLNVEDKWIAVMSDGKTCLAETGPVQFVHPWITIITLRLNKRLTFFIFTNEVIAPEQLRHLRVRLRFRLNHLEDDV